MEDFKYNSVNITAFRIVDVDHPKVKEALEVMEKFQPIGHAILNRSGIIQVSLDNIERIYVPIRIPHISSGNLVFHDDFLP